MVSTVDRGNRAVATTPEPGLEVAESGGERYDSLEMAQQAALGDVAQALAEGIRSALAEGALIVVDGQVVLPRGGEDE